MNDSHDPALMNERAAEWVWCSEVFAVLTNDPCAWDYRHEKGCPCENRYVLTVRDTRTEP